METNNDRNTVDAGFSIYLGEGDINGTTIADELRSGQTPNIDDYAALTRRRIQQLYFAFQSILLDPHQFEKATEVISLREAGMVYLFEEYKSSGRNPKTFPRPRIVAQVFESHQDREILFFKSPGKLIEDLKAWVENNHASDEEAYDLYDHATFFGDKQNEDRSEWSHEQRHLVAGYFAVIDALSTHFPEAAGFADHQPARFLRFCTIMHKIGADFNMHQKLRPEKEHDSIREDMLREYDQAKQRTEKALRSMFKGYRKIHATLSALYKADYSGAAKVVDYETFIKAFNVREYSKIPEFARLGSPTVRGYQGYIRNYLPELADAATPYLSAEEDAFKFDVFPVRVAEDQRLRHSYITGQSGSGKSELLKLIVHEYVTRPEYCAVVVLDPHGDLAEEIARWRVFSGRDQLLYVDPYLKYHHAPTINPFQVRRYNNVQSSEARTCH